MRKTQRSVCNLNHGPFIKLWCVLFIFYSILHHCCDGKMKLVMLQNSLQIFRVSRACLVLRTHFVRPIWFWSSKPHCTLFPPCATNYKHTPTNTHPSVTESVSLLFFPESLAYSCFTQLMKRMSQNFPNGGAMDTHFANMRSLIQVIPQPVPSLQSMWGTTFILRFLNTCILHFSLRQVHIHGPVLNS